MSKEKQIEGYLTTKLKPKNKIELVAWLLLNVFGCKFCKVCRDKPCNIKDGETCTNNIANYIREAVKEEAGYRKQSENTVELPCKVGTTLYFLYNSPYADKPDLTPRIYKTADWYFEVDKTGIVINTSDIHSFNKEYDYHLGKTVFLTQKEAEQALAKMKDGE